IKEGKSMEVPLSGPRLDCVPDGALAQLGERRLCKPEVTGSIPVRSTRKFLHTSLFYRGRGPIGAEWQPIRQHRRAVTPDRPDPRLVPGRQRPRLAAGE